MAPRDEATATRPSEFRGRVWLRVFWRLLDEADKLNIGLISAGVAFYAMLSIFPALTAVIAIWGLVADPQTIGEQIGLARQLLPEEAFRILEDQVATVIAQTASTLQLTGLLSLVLALWTARNGVASLVRGLNAAYREAHRPNVVKRYAVAIGLTLLLIFVALFAFAAVVMVPIVLAFTALPFGVELLVSAIKWLIVIGVVFFSIGLLYRWGPNRRPAQVPWLSPGAVFAVLTWAAGSIAFSLYIRNFGSLNEVYGSIGAAIALQLWYYLSAYLVLFGALLNAELELQTRHDTTVGAARRAGQRNAYVADHVVDPEGRIALAGDWHEATIEPEVDDPDRNVP
ncbi:YihY/virulence factor BrkB family protein [Roseovarius sp.]|uniref:YihY/virulence factor BrkB family protein n=1 Tax=Roseovarius sp. TaxID=1486281 RepID=UPI003BAC7A8D